MTVDASSFPLLSAPWRMDLLCHRTVQRINIVCCLYPPTLQLGAHNVGSDHPGHHVRRSRHAFVAGYAREHAEAVRFAYRPTLDFPAGDGAGGVLGIVRAPIVITSDEFRFVVAEQLRDEGVTADIV